MCLVIWSNCDESINQFDRHCDQSINQFKFKSRVLGVVIFFQKEEISLLIFVSEEDHLGLQIRRNEQVLRCQGR